MKLLLTIALYAMISVGVAEGATGWSDEDMYLQGMFTTLVIIDWGQTLHFRSLGRKESNPFLGTEPTRAEVNIGISMGIVSHAYVAHILPQPWRKIWQLVGISLEIKATSINGSVHGYFTFGF